MTDIISDATHTCRKARTCDQCLRLIHIGQRYRKQVYSDGGLQTYRAHEDCDKAAVAYHSLADLNSDESVLLCEDVVPEDYEWLLSDFPGVADRFGIQGPPKPLSSGQGG